MSNAWRERLISIFLLVFAVWDLVLALGAAVFPDIWFDLFHGRPYDDPQALLRRTGAVWAAFALFHFVAWRRWKAAPFWLIVVGGMRLGEIFADYTYVLLAQDMTTNGTIALLFATPSNIFFSWFFISNGLRRQLGLQYLGPVQYSTLRALSDVLVSGENEVVPPAQIARRVDRYLAAFRAQRKFIAKLALLGIEFYPLLSFKPPFSTMKYERRKAFVVDRFYRDVSKRRITGLFRMLVQAMIRFGQQLSFMGYYSDPATFPTVGYTRFSQRPRFPVESGNVQPPPPLAVQSPRDLQKTDRLTADVVVVGSGAAGAILAHELVVAGRDVLLLERGRHAPRNEFTEDEAEMITKLYDEGALQLATNFRLQVLQGSCVGGTTVVNNAVCFDTPQAVLSRWNDPGSYDAGIDEQGLRSATQAIRTALSIAHQSNTSSILNPSDRYFAAGVKKLGLDLAPNQYASVEANIGRCIGCGYCNIGCAYGTKLDMRETFLPWAQSKTGAGSLKIVAECKVGRIRRDGSKRVGGVDCRLSNGRKLRIDAKDVVLAAGAVSSPYLLLKSGIARDRAGQGASFNIGSPITAKLPEKVDAYDGLQISHFLEIQPDPGYVVETWFNPPVAQALGMPGWFDDHFRNMLAYDHMAAAAPLVGTAPTGRVGVDLFGGLEIRFEPSEDDLRRIKAGLKQVAMIFLEGGAERVMPATFRYLEIKSLGDVSRIDSEIRDASDVTLGTGHPQGGNAISKKSDRGVVDPEFRVRGFENLYCCDASVFPTSVGVNPQLTVMALAKYAAALIR